MDKKAPLCTVFITYYNTGDILLETIDSVLSQDYPNIELIISDDASARVPMPMDKVEAYVREKQKGNIKDLVVRRNERNIGTVKHVELIHDLSRGEYCCGIAGDDLFGDEHVISAMVDHFEGLGPKAEYMIGQVEMFDQKMEVSHGFCVQKTIVTLLKNENWEGLLYKEIEGCKLVGQCMIRRSLLERMPKISDNYTLVEDYSTHMWLLHNRIPIYWCDIIMVKHRGGGMSHGNLANKPQVYINYCRDYMTVFELEIEPYRQDLDKELYEKAVEAYQFFTWQHDSMLSITAHPKIAKLLLIKTPQDLAERKQLLSRLGDPSSVMSTMKAITLLLVQLMIVVMLDAFVAVPFALHALLLVVRYISGPALALLILLALMEIGAICTYRLYIIYRKRKPSYF